MFNGQTVLIVIDYTTIYKIYYNYLNMIKSFILYNNILICLSRKQSDKISIVKNFI